MKNISTILSAVALAGVGILFWLQTRTPRPPVKGPETGGSTLANSFRVAYFDLDTVEAHYDYFKDAQSQVKAKENAMDMELSSIDRNNQKKIDAWRQKGNAMTQAESEQAQQEYASMQQNFQARKTALEQELYKSTEELKTNIRRKIEEFLKEYNKQKSYSFIFAYDPNTLIYYRDTVYNITPDVLEGLNAGYKKK
jgi:outer membrane protein